MKFAHRSFIELGPLSILSPEHWVSTDSSIKLGNGRKLSEIVSYVAKTSTPEPESRFVLDTGNARNGLLDLDLDTGDLKERTSLKKIATEGDIIISRLRPYLRQVALLPVGISDLLGQADFFCSTEFLVFRRLDGENAAGLVAWLLSDQVQSIISQAATGGHHPRISADILLQLPVDERYLDEKFSSALNNVLFGHLKGQRELLVLLRH